MGAKDNGCCGLPSTCAEDVSSGRCKAREEFEKAQAKPRRGSLEAFFGNDQDAINKAREQQERQRQSNSRNRSIGGRER